MYETILVPLDGSGFAQEALPHAKSIAQAVGARVALVRVIETAEQLATSGALQPDPEVAETSQDVLASHHHEEQGLDARNYLQGLEKELAQSGLDVVWAVREGAPADLILAEADEKAAGLMVVTAYGLGGAHTRRENAVFGGVTDSLLRRGRTPVLVIRPR